MEGSFERRAISTADLHELSAHLVRQQRLEAPDWDKRSAPLTGRMWVSELEPGMQLRLADVEDHFGLKSQALLPEGVKIALVLEGSAQVRYGNVETRLGPNDAYSALIATLPEKTRFVRTGQAGTLERTLTLSLSPHWLARHGYKALMEPAARPLDIQHWRPSPGLLSLAGELFEQNHEPRTPAKRLTLAGFATLLAGEALTLAPRQPPARTSKQTRLTTLMALIDRGEARGLDQKALARRLGMSLSTLQRSFYNEYGEALGQFLRRYHLTLARDALSRDGLDVDAASILAGYTSATNFATAFKREFGIVPSHCQPRLFEI
ncbi:helix-turn-helix domain-containing protein [Vreelandella sp. EE22]